MSNNRIIARNKTTDKTYIVYPKTDFKYGKNKDIDWDNMELLNSNYKYEDMDTLKYRLSDTLKNNDDMLDISHLNLDEFPILGGKYIILYDKIKY